MEGKTVRGYYEDGEITFAGPVNAEGCWRVEITFVEREDAENTPYEVSPHRHQNLPVPDRMEEMHRQMESQKPPTVPY